MCVYRCLDRPIYKAVGGRTKESRDSKNKRVWPKLWLWLVMVTVTVHNRSRLKKMGASLKLIKSMIGFAEKIRNRILNVN